MDLNKEIEQRMAELLKKATFGGLEGPKFKHFASADKGGSAVTYVNLFEPMKALVVYWRSKPGKELTCDHEFAASFVLN